jgi:ferredoxin--NADP+ reductase
MELTGPFGEAFPTPEDKSANLLMICLGTGIAPFRALIQRIYRDIGEWEGQVRLFHGAQTGLELLYENDENADLVYYYDKKTFKAIEALSPRPHVGAPAALDRALEENAEEVWYLLQSESAHLYIAGLEKMVPQLERAFRKVAGSEERWERLKAELIRSGRWFEILY